ncbi:MAG: threonylcarbamoyl-AMP synthase [Bacteroidales bacterium]|nr:threonylcarbamoyl-AMP synthase [Bacteroidales bacterium]
MKILRMYPTSINDRYLDEVVDTLRRGGLIIYPTDTVYAIGCDALNSRAIEKVCRIKGLNPDKNTLSIIAADMSMAAEYARIDNKAFHMLKDNLPGPFTFILPAATTLPKAFKGRHTVGVRIPDNAIATAIARELCNPILSTSIMPDADGNYPVDPQAIALEVPSEIDLVIDGGEGSSEVSTVVNATDSTAPEILRQGAGELQ